jgi:hypothetical protein
MTSFHVYETHPKTGLEVTIFVDDESVYASCEDDDDFFFSVTVEEDNIIEAVADEFGDEMVDRLMLREIF